MPDSGFSIRHKFRRTFWGFNIARSFSQIKLYPDTLVLQETSISIYAWGIKVSKSTTAYIQKNTHPKEINLKKSLLKFN